VYLTQLNEQQFLATAEVMAQKLKRYGYRYMVIDGGWMGPATEPAGPLDIMDQYGRYLPDAKKFPSTLKSRSFRTLSNRIRKLGLKFGIHYLRGVPRVAAEAKLPILGSQATLDDIADRTSLCGWNNMMYGARSGSPASQAYFDSVFAQWAEWGVDFVKMDDISSPYHAAEVEMVARAAKKSGRPMVLSLSPGDENPVENAAHAAQYSHMWRISPDFWDQWSDLRRNLDRLAVWAPYARDGGWPDADMLPVGRLLMGGSGGDQPERSTRFTWPEQQTLVAAWSIARSPLMIGGDLLSMDDKTIGLLTNSDLLAANQKGSDPQEVFRKGDLIGWRTTVGRDAIIALFNVGDTAWTGPLDLATFGIAGTAARDAWTQKELPIVDNVTLSKVPRHGCAVYRIYRAKKVASKQ
jgi:hypothetical protein